MPKRGRPFFDTNVLIYAFASNDPRAGTAELLLAQGGTVGVQNLNEFAAVAARKMKMSWPDIREALGAIRTLCPTPVPMTIKIHEAAVEIAARYHFQIYDALVIAAASAASSPILYSEDLQAGQVIGGVTVRNPFSILTDRVSRKSAAPRSKKQIPFPPDGIGMEMKKQVSRPGSG